MSSRLHSLISEKYCCFIFVAGVEGKTAGKGGKYDLRETEVGSGRETLLKVSDCLLICDFVHEEHGSCLRAIRDHFMDMFSLIVNI